MEGARHRCGGIVPQIENYFNHYLGPCRDAPTPPLVRRLDNALFHLRFADIE
jgi:hypothetical protein